MASITIRNLDETVLLRLRVRAATRNRSMEDEAGEILRTALNTEASESTEIGSAIHALFAPLGGLNFPVIERQPMHEPPDFG